MHNKQTSQKYESILLHPIFVCMNTSDYKQQHMSINQTPNISP